MRSYMVRVRFGPDSSEIKRLDKLLEADLSRQSLLALFDSVFAPIDFFGFRNEQLGSILTDP